MTYTLQICSVQSVEGLDDAHETTRRFRYLLASTRCRVARHCRVLFQSGYRPATFRKGRGVTSQRLNRALPAHTDCAPGSRITNRNDNHAHWTTGWVKKLWRPFGVTTTAAVCHARARAIGFRLVVCEPRDTQKLRTSSESHESFKSNGNSEGGCCLQPT